mmetsp:Transcript_66379/g.144095  ORF Transcript_66379/g.144095 Transcript_66379/m.144095 type:complete len:204 (-) Transcript_66379:411-1022(-)
MLPNLVDDIGNKTDASKLVDMNVYEGRHPGQGLLDVLSSEAGLAKATPLGVLLQLREAGVDGQNKVWKLHRAASDVVEAACCDFAYAPWAVQEAAGREDDQCLCVVFDDLEETTQVPQVVRVQEDIVSAPVDQGHLEQASEGPGGSFVMANKPSERLWSQVTTYKRRDDGHRDKSNDCNACDQGQYGQGLGIRIVSKEGGQSK